MTHKHHECTTNGTGHTVVHPPNTPDSNSTVHNDTPLSPSIGHVSMISCEAFDST